MDAYVQGLMAQIAAAEAADDVAIVEDLAAARLMPEVRAAITSLIQQEEALLDAGLDAEAQRISLIRTRLIVRASAGRIDLPWRD